MNRPVVASRMGTRATSSAAQRGVDTSVHVSCSKCSRPGFDDVFAASMVLLAGIYPNIQHKKLKVKDRSWDAAKKQCLGNIKEYIEYLKEIKVKVSDSASNASQFLNLNFAAMASTPRHAHATPSMVPKESLNGVRATQVDESADLSVQMKEVRPLIALEHFNVETMTKKSAAAAGLTEAAAGGAVADRRLRDGDRGRGRVVAGVAVVVRAADRQ